MALTGGAPSRVSGVTRDPAQAAQVAVETTTALAERGLSVVTALLDGQAAVCDTHYPAGDEIDTQSGFRYYYHSHAGLPWQRQEHGHFHLFTESSGGFHHLAALSVDAQGLPMRVFTTNRWVTGEQWLAAPELLFRVAEFSMAETGPRATVNRWLNAMVCLFLPQLETVIHNRDARVRRELTRGRTQERFLKDRRTHVLSQVRLSLMERLDALA